MCLTILYGYEIINGLVWVEIMDGEGRTGWIPQVYLLVVTPTSTPTSRASATPSPEATAVPWDEPTQRAGLLGHLSLEMTRRYVQMMDEDLVEAHRMYGPVDHALKK
jgi:hypothetical protein